MKTHETNPDPAAWKHGDVLAAIDMDGFSPPESRGFVLRPLASTQEGIPVMLLGTLEPGGIVPRELHETAREHLLVLEGEVRYQADDGTSVTLRPGQMGRLNANTWHLIENRGSEPSRFIVSLA